MVADLSSQDLDFLEEILRYGTPEQVAAVEQAIGDYSDIPLNGMELYSPHDPFPKQKDFLDLDCYEGFYGGAAGPGKTDALVMAALQYVHIPGYAALILRKDCARLRLPGSIMDRCEEWLRGSDVRFNATNKVLHFPSGAKIQFGYISRTEDRRRYQSAEFQLIAWDELTEFSLGDGEENPYLFLMSRCRRPSCHWHRDEPHPKCYNCRQAGLLRTVPLRIRSASNPGGTGHDFVRKRFLSEEAEQALKERKPRIFYRGYRNFCQNLPECGQHFFTPEVKAEKCDQCGSTNLTAKLDRAFIPALLKDNPAIDYNEYMFGLSNLPPVTRERLVNGDWSVIPGTILKPEWWREYLTRGDILAVVDAGGEDVDQRATVDRRQFCRKLVVIDTAGTEKDKKQQQTQGRQSNMCMQAWWWWPERKWLFMHRQELTPGKECTWEVVKEKAREFVQDFEPSETLIENAHWGPPLKSEMAADSTCGGNYRLVDPKGSKLARSTRFQQKMRDGEIFLPYSVSEWRRQVDSEWMSWRGEDEDYDDSIDCVSHVCNHVDGSRRGAWGGTLGNPKGKPVASQFAPAPKATGETSYDSGHSFG